jgi:hypothetical protein
MDAIENAIEALEMYEAGSAVKHPQIRERGREAIKALREYQKNFTCSEQRVNETAKSLHDTPHASHGSAPASMSHAAPVDARDGGDLLNTVNQTGVEDGKQEALEEAQEWLDEKAERMKPESLYPSSHRVIRTLKQALAQAGVPDGWVLVPKSFFRGRLCSCGMPYKLHCKCEFCGNGSPHIKAPVSAKEG